MRGVLIPKNKKGDAMSILIFLAVMFVSIVSLIFLTKVFQGVTTTLKSAEIIQENAKAMEKITQVETGFVPWMGGGLVFIFFGSIFGIIVSSFFIDTHPGFFIFFLIITIVAIVLAGIFANIITEIGEMSDLSAVWAQYPGIQVIVNNLPLIVLITSAIVGIILFSKSGGSNSQL